MNAPIKHQTFWAILSTSLACR